MKNKGKEAVEYFKNHHNCAQSVLLPFAGDLKIDHETAKRIASGFGTGMGKMQKTCGAVTGSFMVLGLHNGNQYEDNSLVKKRTAEMIRDFSREFEKTHGSIECRALLNVDISTEEGNQFAHAEGLFEKICEKCISDAVKILQNLIY
ncbi:MAG: C-GCAxxG-C-C family protein [Bacteroidales bacterium]|nr:C-GCAxxG-C-C family protein [Bacteroidales bacterium]MCF8399036.1 C-GCAxxG-C-C family protein [Bacteroidales bacterium]